MIKKSKSASVTKQRKRKDDSDANHGYSGQPATKLDKLVALLARRDGTTIGEMVSATGWQPHSVRGALAGALKRRGLVITSEKVDGVRRYRSEVAQ